MELRQSRKFIRQSKFSRLIDCCSQFTVWLGTCTKQYHFFMITWSLPFTLPINVPCRGLVPEWVPIKCPGFGGESNNLIQIKVAAFRDLNPWADHACDISQPRGFDKQLYHAVSSSIQRPTMLYVVLTRSRERYATCTCLTFMLPLLRNRPIRLKWSESPRQCMKITWRKELEWCMQTAALTPFIITFKARLLWILWDLRRRPTCDQARVLMITRLDVFLDIF